MAGPNPVRSNDASVDFRAYERIATEGTAVLIR